MNYSDTYCPISTTAASEKLLLIHFDVKTAFFYGEFEESIYMRPQG